MPANLPGPAAPSARAHPAWACYDEVAATYARVAAPRYFQPPARHLVRLLGPHRGERFLDVGCGTGAVAAEAAAVLGAPAVAGVDLSPGMLAQARGAARSLVAAGLPELPWRDGSFDVAASGFVLTHLADAPAALEEIRRILRSGGRLGVSAWEKSPSENEQGEAWTRVASAFVDPEALRAAVERQLPGERRFSRPTELARALTAAGFAVEIAETVPFAVTLPTRDYVDSRLLSLGSRFMQSALPPETWGRFVKAASDALWENFGSELLIRTSVALAVGTR